MPPRREFGTYTNALHELVDRTMVEKNLLLREVSAKGGLPAETVGVIRRGDRPLRTPLRQETMERLAKGLGLPYSAVQEAVFASLPKPPRELDEDTQAVVNMMRSMSAAKRRKIRALVEVA